MATKTEPDVLESVPPAPDMSALFANVDLEALIAAQVKQAVESQNKSKETPIVEAESRGTQAHMPTTYIRHYRCDVSPDVTIQRRVYNADQDKLEEMLPGERIVFRRGHFFSTDQSEDDQLQWMMRNPSFDPRDPSRVIGGNPTIYEDDGRDLVACQHCGEPFVRGSNAYKSHLRASHGVT